VVDWHKSQVSTARRHYYINYFI